MDAFCLGKGGNISSPSFFFSNLFLPPPSHPKTPQFPLLPLLTFRHVSPIRPQPRLLSPAGWISASGLSSSRPGLPAPAADAVSTGSPASRRKEPRLSIRLYRHALLLLALRRDMRVLS